MANARWFSSGERAYQVMTDVFGKVLCVGMGADTVPKSKSSFGILLSTLKSVVIEFTLLRGVSQPLRTIISGYAPDGVTGDPRSPL